MKTVFFECTATPIARKALTIGLVLMALDQFSGLFPMIHYTSTIFKQSGSSLSPNLSSIIVALLQLLGTSCSTLLVDRAGRKVSCFLYKFQLFCFPFKIFQILFATSAIATGLGLLCLSVYIFLGTIGIDCTRFDWIPIFSYSWSVFMGQLGMLSLNFMVMAEVLPPKIRAAGCTIGLMVLWTLSFTMIKLIPMLAEILGLHGLFFGFAVCCFCGAVFIILAIPETKGKSIEDIMKIL